MAMSGQTAAKLSVSSFKPSIKPFHSRLVSKQHHKIPHFPPKAVSSPDTAADNQEQEDPWQIPDRAQWYIAKFAADDQPDWQPALFISSAQLAPGVKEVVLDVEISRERVPIRNAYKHIGQRASVRVNGGTEQHACPSSPPFTLEQLRKGLLRVRGDLTAGETKIATEEGSARGELRLVVEDSVASDLYKSGPGDLFEVGPFSGNGLNLRGQIAAVFRYPTIIMFCENPAGLATAKALITASTDVGGLSLNLRKDVRMYYRAPNQASLCYKDELDSWAELYNVKVITSTRDSFQDMFDDDNTLMYEPETTAAIILTGAEGGECEEAAVEVCKEAEINEALVVKHSEEQPATRYLKNGKEYFDDK